jgi:hypothetical protein
MTVWSFCPDQIKETLSKVIQKNKGDKYDLDLYRQNWINWIKDFSGCENKKYWAVCNGIHDALINQVSYKHKNVNKFYAFIDDYKFYQVILRPYNHELISPKYISKIEPDSYILVSQPNHEGKITDWFSDLVDHCKQINTSIFLDCAFYGTTFDNLDTSDYVFDSVAFSLSKNFLLGGLRAGIVFSDSLAETLTLPISTHFTYNYFNCQAVASANAILPKYKSSFITEFAKPRQIEYCLQNNLKPADIWMWAFDNQGHKICITEYIRHKVQLDLNTRYPIISNRSH